MTIIRHQHQLLVMITACVCGMRQSWRLCGYFERGTYCCLLKSVRMSSGDACDRSVMLTQQSYSSSHFLPPEHSVYPGESTKKARPAHQKHSASDEVVDRSCLSLDPVFPRP